MERHSAIEPSVGNRAWSQGGCCREQPITNDSGVSTVAMVGDSRPGPGSLFIQSKESGSAIRIGAIPWSVRTDHRHPIIGIMVAPVLRSELTPWCPQCAGSEYGLLVYTL